MTRESPYISQMPINSIGIGEVPNDIVEGEPTPFSLYYSDTAICKECFQIFSMTFIFDSRCPFCGSFVDHGNIVVSSKGPEASYKRAVELSKSMKEQKKRQVVFGEEGGGYEDYENRSM